MDPKLQLQAVAGGDRHVALQGARDALESAGAWLLDVRLFSDLSACFEIELPAAAGPALNAALTERGIRLDPPSARCLDALGEAGAGEVAGTLALFFTSGQGELRHEVPAVPG